MTNFIKQTRTKFVRQTIEIATRTHRAKTSIYLYALLAMGVTSPFLHVLTNNHQEGIFGFPYMTSFLFAIGFPITVVCLGLIIKFASAKVDQDFKTPFKVISHLVTGLGVFYLIWTVSPVVDFPKPVYYVALCISSIIITSILGKLHRAVIASEEKLKACIRKLFTHIITTIPKKYILEADLQQYSKDYEVIINDIAPQQNEYNKKH